MNEKFQKAESLIAQYRILDRYAESLEGYNKDMYRRAVRKASEGWETLKNFISENIRDMELIHALEENPKTKVDFHYAYSQVISEANVEQVYEERGW